MLTEVGPDEMDLAAELERGQIVYFRIAPIALPSAEDQEFLRTAFSAHLRRKNLSWYGESDRLVGVEEADAAIQERARSILVGHSSLVRRFLEQSMPTFMKDARFGTVSMRPIEQRERGLPAHANDGLVHVDGGAYGATHGDRLLRFFVNLNPTADRVWASRGTLSSLLPRWAEPAGLRGFGSLEPGAVGRAWSRSISTGARVWPRLKMLDSSPYDRAMRRLHNFMKDSPDFQSEAPETCSFKPFSAWIVLSDVVSHACLEGQHALVSTFVVPLANCARPELSPFHLLASIVDGGR
jgi:hypothetical protein